jgi:hypothetical protein
MPGFGNIYRQCSWGFGDFRGWRGLDKIFEESRAVPRYTGGLFGFRLSTCDFFEGRSEVHDGYGWQDRCGGCLHC